MKRRPATVTHRHGRCALRLGPWQGLIRPRQVLACIAGALLLTLVALWVLPRGLYDIPVKDMWRTGSDHALQRLIWQDIRLPRILVALLAGAMLGAAGAAMQTLARNGLADPGLVGVKEGAVAAVVGIAVFAPHVDPIWRGAIGLAGGLTVAAAVALLARDLSKARFVLVGIGMSWGLHGVIACFLTTVNVLDAQAALVWLAGSLHGASWSVFRPMALWAVIGAVLLAATARAADLSLLGHSAATGLGANVRRTAAVRFFAVCLLTAAAVATVGSLGFVGLIAPHLSRLTLGGRQLSLLSGSALYGAGLVLVADSIGRLAFAPLQIPAGIVMAIVGVPFLLALLWQRRNQL